MRLRTSILALAAIVNLWGQAHRSVILGRVTDASGAAVPGAAVHVIAKSTNTTRTATTNAGGNYEVSGLFPDTYRIEAASAGFKKTVVDDVALTSGRSVEVNLRAEIGELKETVTVTAEKQLLDTTNADTNTIIGTRKVMDLPIGQGHASYLFLALPGADSASAAGRGGSGMDVQPIQRQGTSQTRFNGSPQGTTEYTLDGTPNTQRGNSLAGGGSAFNPSAEVVQEVRVQTNTFDSSIGHTGGATVDLVLKGGTNELHGSALGFFRSPEWNANSWSGNRGGVPRQDFTYRRYGFTGGGPVWIPGLFNGKNRTFFHYGFERWSSLSPNPPTFITVPSPEQIGGDFSKLLRIGGLYQLYDPDTGRAAAGGRIQRTPLAGNIIPASRIHAMSKTLSALWPQPNNAGTADGQLNFSYNNAPNPRKYWSSTLRLDHSLTDKHRLFGRMILSQSTIPSDTLFGRTDIPGIDLTGKNRDVAFSDVWTISSSFIADFRASIMRFHWLSTPMGLGLPFQSYGLGNLTSLLDTTRTGFPAVVVGGYTGFTNSAGSRDISDIRNASAHFTKVAGQHGVKFGAELRWYIDNRGNEDLFRYQFPGSYSNGPLDNSPAPPIGAGLSDFLLGRFASATASQPSKAANLSTYQGFYIQDDWKVAPRFTVNIGLRYEREGPPTERFNRSLSGFDFNSANPVSATARANYAASPIPEIAASQFLVRGGVLFSGVGGQTRTSYATDRNNFAPRIGAVYQVTQDMVIRAGYGLFYIPYGQRFFSNEGGVPGFDVTTTSLSTPDSGLTFNRTFDNPFAAGLDKPTGSTLGPLTFTGQAINLRALGNMPNAYNQRWQFSLQRRMAGVWKMDLRYVGNHTVKMPIASNVNALPNSYLSRSPERDNTVNNQLTGLVNNPFFGVSGVGGTIGTSRTIARSQLLRPYPEFGALTLFNNQGWSTYHALQVELERSLTRGFTVQTSYTFAKTIDGLDYLNEGDPVPERVISAANRPHIFRFLALYELPFGKGRRYGAGWSGASSYLISGWQIQSFSFLQSGAPLAWGNVLFRGDVHNLPVSSQGPDQMFNTNAGFEKTTALQLASNLRTFPSKLAGVRNTRETNTDFSVIKNNRIGERLQVQFRAEAYNWWNQHFFVSANTTPTNAAFGTTTAATSPRAVQLGVRATF
ncbi:MAG: TonB-dependent receptor [Candidatus Solibacter usitatus]|nr:TonB-dependent receptor [Candidatus Solibacter usitatus]